MAIDKDELKKMSPAERLKRLKELEEERKKDIDETTDLIKRTEAELNDRSPLFEVPELEPVDISKLFLAEEGLEAEVHQPSEEENNVKYTGNVAPVEASYDVPDEHDWVRGDISQREFIKYESTTEKADELTGSRSLLKNIKKYMSG